MCFFTAGMLADFLGRLSEETVAVMEVECRSRGDARCRFLSATPEVLEKVYKDRKSTRLNSSHLVISYAVFCLKKKTMPRTSAACARRRDAPQTTAPDRSPPG